LSGRGVDVPKRQLRARPTDVFVRRDTSRHAPVAESEIAASFRRAEAQNLPLGSGSYADRWYGDGAPNWFEGRNDRPAMTRREARIQRRRDVKMLRRHGKNSPSILRLADKIESCRQGRRCLSAACIVCRRATQRLVVSVGDRLFRRSSAKFLAVSVISKGTRIAAGELRDERDVFRPQMLQLRRALRAARIRQAFGGFDISANEHAEGRFAPHYRPHAYLFIPARQFARGERVFRSYFPPSATIRRPVVVKPFDCSLRGLAYAQKANFQRRVTLPRERLANGEVKRRNTRDRPLRALQKLEIALALDRIGLGGRIFVHGLQIRRVGEKLRLVQATFPESQRRPP
jgi:hypothetical protein